jgi:hypothetical protein
MAVGIVWGLGTAFSALSPLATGRAIDLFGFAAAYLSMAVLALGGALLARRLPG